MNQYTELLNYLKLLALRYGANTVTKDAPDSIDLQKTNIFPLVNISIANGSFSNGSTISFNVVLEAITNRDANKEVVDDKFWSNDNEVDNHNNTLAILNKMWVAMYRDFEDKNITSSESPTFEKITLGGTNLLDGWELSFDVELPNTTLNLCQ
jgi:hypothetical protein